MFSPSFIKVKHGTEDGTRTHRIRILFRLIYLLLYITIAMSNNIVILINAIIIYYNFGDIIHLTRLGIFVQVIFLNALNCAYISSRRLFDNWRLFGLILAYQELVGYWHYQSKHLQIHHLILRFV